ncbi:hypothetical protein Pmgp_02383 [Pelotomaculum propionicicum]|uniref:Uncharacterized protein n=1 Tax=Pelotomaculum propionicicum TaxID=258475 RepID=A0A4Y7RNA2_9FIRM|nr:hypothetical protein Pmgp_02383 [Pelotomaculum propionicicum]
MEFPIAPKSAAVGTKLKEYTGLTTVILYGNIITRGAEKISAPKQPVFEN